MEKEEGLEGIWAFGVDLAGCVKRIEPRIKVDMAAAAEIAVRGKRTVPRTPDQQSVTRRPRQNASQWPASFPDNIRIEIRLRARLDYVA